MTSGPAYGRTLHTVSLTDLRGASVSGQINRDGFFIVIAKELVNLIVGGVTKKSRVSLIGVRKAQLLGTSYASAAHATGGVF